MKNGGYWLFLSVLGLAATAFGVDRFPPPELGPENPLPQIVAPLAGGAWRGYLDMALLLAALSLASWLALKARRRRWIFGLMLASLVYFGFVRHGCVCPVGATQNLTQALSDSTYTIPLVVLAFGLLPLFFTLFFGRSFCAAVCPLGAIQDAVLVQPLRLPMWLTQSLGFLPFLFLGLALLSTALGSGYLICRWDPFVGFFRLTGTRQMLVMGGIFLVVGTVLGRPYCRWFCAYGALLRLAGSVSKWRVTITPDRCIQCRLCENACPFGAIRVPNAGQLPPDRAAGRRRLLLLLALLPVFLLPAAYLSGRGLGPALAQAHPTVKLAQRVALEEAGKVQGTTFESDAFRGRGRSLESLYEEARTVRQRHVIGARLLGAFLVLVIFGFIFRASIWRTRTDYEADRGECLACGRCFAFCPIEQERLKKLAQEAAATS